MEYNKVEVWARDKGYHLRIVLQDPVLGDIYLFSNHFDGLREADSRAVAVSRHLGLKRDNLPVHRSK